MKAALVLLSGGLDSSTTLAVAFDEGHEAVDALTVRYGQRHGREAEAARAVAAALGVRRHEIVDLDLETIARSALTSGEIEIPRDRPLDEMAEGIPATYVPARNTVLLSLALAWSEVLESETIYVGATAVDFSGYPDCRPEYYRAFEEVARLGTKRGVEGNPVEVRAPLIALSKADIVRKAVELDVPLDLTWSCYLGDAKACGLCDACQLRLKGFQEAGVEDPLPYAARPSWFRRGWAR